MISKIQNTNVSFGSKVTIADSAVSKFNRFEKILSSGELAEFKKGIKILEDNGKKDAVTLFIEEGFESKNVGLRLLKKGKQMLEGFASVSLDCITFEAPMLKKAYIEAVKNLKLIEPSELNRYRI